MGDRPLPAPEQEAPLAAQESRRGVQNGTITVSAQAGTMASLKVLASMCTMVLPN